MKIIVSILLLITSVSVVALSQSSLTEYATYTEEYSGLIEANGKSISIYIQKSEGSEDPSFSLECLADAENKAKQTQAIIEFYRAIRAAERGNFEYANHHARNSKGLWSENFEFVSLHALCHRKYHGQISSKEVTAPLREQSPLSAYLDLLLQIIDESHSAKHSKKDLTLRQLSFISKLEELNQISPIKALDIQTKITVIAVSRDVNSGEILSDKNLGLLTRPRNELPEAYCAAEALPKVLGEKLLKSMKRKEILTWDHFENNGKNNPNRVDPTVKTPVELGNEQGTAGHP